jgi:hypothetical protein
VKPYTEIDGLEDIVLEESYVLGITATPGQLVFKVDFVLTTDHPLYQPPPAGTIECFRRGGFRFQTVKSLQWSDQGAPPTRDPNGEIDYGHIEWFEWKPGCYRLEGGWGFIEVAGGDVQVTIDEADS